jgi:hypothetical protein
VIAHLRVCRVRFLFLLGGSVRVAGLDTRDSRFPFAAELKSVCCVLCVQSHFLESEGGGIRVFLADCDNQEGICFL